MTDEDFVRTWQTSETLADVASRTKLTQLACSARASRLRGNGVPLRKFTVAGRPRTDYSELIKLAVSLDPEQK